MRKRDQMLYITIWLSRAIIGLGVAIYLLVLWRLFSIWLSLNVVLKGAILLGTGLSLLTLPKRVKPVLSGENIKQWKHIEALRMNSQEAFLDNIPLEVNETKFALPFVLRARLSSGVYVSFAVFWFGIALLLLKFFGEEAKHWEMLLLFWIILGGLIIGITGIFMYRRVEATEQYLLVRVGLTQKKLFWKQASLFAKVRIWEGEGMPEQYELSGASALLRWPALYPPSFGVITYPKRKEDYERWLYYLLVYIHKQTSLPLINLH